jgi:hypothetical protein
MSILRVMDKVFDDKRVAVAVLMLWLTIVMTIFKDIGLLDTSFMQFGPSPTAKFMGVILDTWYKWGMVAAFTFFNTAMNDFMSDAISPWIINTITDHKTRFIPYPKIICLGIAQMWAIYCNLMSVFGMFLAMTQIDFVLIRMLADLSVNTYTNMKFMRGKEYSVDMYYACDMELQGMVKDPVALEEEARKGVEKEEDKRVPDDKRRLRDHDSARDSQFSIEDELS